MSITRRPRVSVQLQAHSCLLSHLSVSGFTTTLTMGWSFGHNDKARKQARPF